MNYLVIYAIVRIWWTLCNPSYHGLFSAWLRWVGFFIVYLVLHERLLLLASYHQTFILRGRVVHNILTTPTFWSLSSIKYGPIWWFFCVNRVCWCIWSLWFSVVLRAQCEIVRKTNKSRILFHRRKEEKFTGIVHNFILRSLLFPSKYLPTGILNFPAVLPPLRTVYIYFLSGILKCANYCHHHHHIEHKEKVKYTKKLEEGKKCMFSEFSPGWKSNEPFRLYPRMDDPDFYPSGQDRPLWEYPRIHRSKHTFFHAYPVTLFTLLLAWRLGVVSVCSANDKSANTLHVGKEGYIL